MSASLEFLVNLLDLEPIEVNIFRGIQPNEERQRVFGGQALIHDHISHCVNRSLKAAGPAGRTAMREFKLIARYL